MAGSHTSTSAREMSSDPSPVTLVSSAVGGLPEQLAGRVDSHLARFAEHMREGLLAASTAVGSEVMAELMAAEVTALAGPKGKHDRGRVAKRHGSDHGTVTLGGRRVPVRRPRVRSVGDDEHEVALESYDTFASTDLLADGIVAQPGDDRVLKQPPSRSDPTVHRRWSRAPSLRQAHHLPARQPLRSRLPRQPVEQVRRPNVGQPHTALG